MFQSFTGFEYLLIDLANHRGLDKEVFNDRLDWCHDHFDDLEQYAHDADKPLLYTKALSAIRKAQRGEATGHMVGLDATASGLQIMGVATGCEVTANNTGLVNPLVRADIYTTTTGTVNEVLMNQGIVVAPSRGDIKQAQMTYFYGSSQQPILLFGEGTNELAAFFEAQEMVAPGACELRDILLHSWDRDARSHDFILPDGFESVCRVQYPIDMRIEVDELDHASFTHRVNVNMSTNEYEAHLKQYVPDGLSNAANPVHACDGMVMREMNRRCNHNGNEIYRAHTLLTGAYRPCKGRPGAWLHRYNESRFAPTNLLSQVSNGNVHVSQLPEELRLKLVERAETMLDRPSFQMLGVHDEFRVQANYGDELRLYYREIMAELADSTFMQDILRQLTGQTTNTLNKRNPKLGDLIRNSNYGIC